MSRLTDELWFNIDQVEGWLLREEAELLDSLNTGIWCEIGCWKGKSTAVLALGGPGYAIDWFRGSSEHAEDTNTYADFERNLRALNVWDRVIVKARPWQSVDSREIAMIDLLHIDGEHTYSETRTAFETFGPKVVPGGHVVIHDVWGENEKHNLVWPEVTRFALELMDYPDWKHVGDARRSAAFVKV